jgi:hypothetical protein
MKRKIANERRRPVDAKVVGNIWSSAVRFASLFNTDQVGGPHAIEAGEKKKMKEKTGMN